MSELDNCCGTTCDKQKLAEEINALKAQVENFRNHLKALTRWQNHVDQSERASALEAMKAIPAQCLAEIKAQAGREGFIEATAIDWNQYSEDEIKEAAEQYGDKIRQRAKAGDL